MNLIKLSSTDLRQVLRLLEQRDELLQQVAQVERQLTALEGGQSVPVAAAKAPALKAAKLAAGKAGQRRKMKPEVIALLKSAGTVGLTVTEIAQRMGLDVNRVFTWFYATGSKNKAIKKVGNAQYRWVA